MSELNLVPNVPVVIVQLAVFLSNIVVVDKLFLKPYLKLRDKRDELTKGKQLSAQQLALRCQELETELQTKILNARQSATKTLETLVHKAHEQRVGLIHKAEKESKDTLEKLRSELQTNLLEEKEKLYSQTKNLSDQIFLKLLS